MKTTIDHVGRSTDHLGRSDTESPARIPDQQGLVERDGVGIHWDAYGDRGRPAILLLPSWSIVHSRLWKAQIAHLARHFRVVSFDGRGNGLSDRPEDPAAYATSEFVADAVAVLDAAGEKSAAVAGISKGGRIGLMLTANHPELVEGLFLIAPSIPCLNEPQPGGDLDFEEERDEYHGWHKYNRHYWLRDHRGFLEFFFAQAFPESHSTKQIEDCVAWGLDMTAETLVQTTEGGDPIFSDREAVEGMCREVHCPVAVVHGSHDVIAPIGVGEQLAELVGAQFVRLEGCGHIPNARDPVQINVMLREFAERLDRQPPARQGQSWTRAMARPKRALYISSPIGLGHAWRDVRIADELRRRVPGLEIEWLAQEPVTTVLRERGETIHPASSELASEVAHIDREAQAHDLHVFEALRRMDEIFCANYMVFDDVVRDQAFDVWIGDEAWELDHFLHENPERKRAPFVWLTDFVGYLPMPARGEREAQLTADYNAEMIGHIERHPRVRDRAIFVGNPEDIVSESFGPGLPRIREWTERHYDFSGYIPGFDRGSLPDRAALRDQLGYGDEPLCVVSVGGSGVGAPLLERAIEALPGVRERVPGLRAVAVAGPGIDPAGRPTAEGLEVRGYVHELFRHLAACDVAVAQGGLTTTMELVSAGRPFVSLPLSSHFEQQYHVRHRLERCGAFGSVDYAEASPEVLADAIAGALATAPKYRPVESGGAARAAELIAEVL
ncbi:hypothetical protein BH10ACT11_BH10ACT11_09270 [soil metagenome]